MYIPPAFRVDDIADVHGTMREARSATLSYRHGKRGLIGTPLPMLLDESEGPYGTLYAHIAKANPQWTLDATVGGDGHLRRPRAYVSPSWYATKRRRTRSCRRGTTSPSTPMARSSPSTMRIGCSTRTRLTDLHEAPRDDGGR